MEILGAINLDEFTSSEEQTPSMKNSPNSNKENKAPTDTPTCSEAVQIVDDHVKTAAKLNTTTLFTLNSKTLQRKSSVLAEETFLTQQRLIHELRIKKLILEIKYTREEHVVKMRRLTKDLNEPLAAHCNHGHE